MHDSQPLVARAFDQELEVGVHFRTAASDVDQLDLGIFLEPFEDAVRGLSRHVEAVLRLLGEDSTWQCRQARLHTRPMFICNVVQRSAARSSLPTLSRNDSGARTGSATVISSILRPGSERWTLKSEGPSDLVPPERPRSCRRLRTANLGPRRVPCHRRTEVRGRCMSPSSR